MDGAGNVRASGRRRWGVAVRSHELARLLLELPDLPVATHALNNTWADGERTDSMRVGLLSHYAGDHIIVGDISRMNLNSPNYFVSKMFHGEARWDWWKPGLRFNETVEEKRQAEATIALLVERMRKHREDCERVTNSKGRLRWTIGGL